MIELNTIYNEDCLETMKRMPDNFVDLTVTSPPYDNLRTYNGYSFDFESIAQELYRVTKDGGVVVWVVGDSTKNGSESGTSFRQALYFKEVGFNLHDTMIYQKENAIPLTHNRYEQQFEYMFVLSKGRPKAFNPIMIDCIHAGRKNPSGTFRNNKLDGTTGKSHTPKAVSEKKIKYNVWSYQVGNMKSTKDKIAFEHPAIYPEQLAYDHIISWSNDSDTVYDPFMGSGTTAKACIDLNRNYIGSEISKEYCEIAERRLGQEVLL